MLGGGGRKISSTELVVELTQLLRLVLASGFLLFWWCFGKKASLVSAWCVSVWVGKTHVPAASAACVKVPSDTRWSCSPQGVGSLSFLATGYLIALGLRHGRQGWKDLICERLWGEER